MADYWYALASKIRRATEGGSSFSEHFNSIVSVKNVNLHLLSDACVKTCSE